MVIAYVNADGTLSDDCAYYDKRTMAESLRRVADSDGVKAYVLPLAPILPEDKTRAELTELLQKAMEYGLAELHRQVLKV